MVKKGYFGYIREANKPKDEYLMHEDVEIKPYVAKDYKFSHKFNFSRIHTHTKSSWKNNEKNIKTTFILDIDLDYFVCNGDKYTKTKYKRDFGDIESTGRVHEIPGIIVPRSIYTDKNSASVIKRLNKEYKLIMGRINVFLDGLKYLHKRV